MTSHATKIDSVQFARVAAQCKWSERSLGVAKALIVDEVSLSEVAASHSMSPQQANMIRIRFIAKADKLRVEAFTQREKPRLCSSAIKPYSSEIQTLRNKGYTIEQIVMFLKENGVSISSTTVRNFLKNIQA